MLSWAVLALREIMRSSSNEEEDNKKKINKRSRKLLAKLAEILDRAGPALDAATPALQTLLDFYRAMVRALEGLDLSHPVLARPEETGGCRIITAGAMQVQPRKGIGEGPE